MMKVTMERTLKNVSTYRRPVEELLITLARIKDEIEEMESRLFRATGHAERVVASVSVDASHITIFVEETTP